MNKFAWVILTLTLATSAWAERDIDQTISTVSNPKVDISVDNATVVIEGWDKNEVRVKGTLGDDVDDFEFDDNGSRGVDIELRQHHEKSWGGWGGGWGNNDTILTVSVPTSSAVSYEAVAGSVKISKLKQGPLSVEMVMGPVEINDFSGNVEVESVNGNVTLSQVAGNIEVETVNGNVEIVQVEDGSLEVGSVNGNLTIETAATAIEVEAVSGPIELNAGVVDRLDVEVVSSNFSGRMQLAERAEISAETVSGSLKFVFEGPIDLDVDIETMSGRIDNGLNDTEVVVDDRGHGRYLQTTVGKGTGRFEASTLSGYISLVSD